LKSELRNYPLYLILFLPYPLLAERGSVASYFYALFLIYFAINFRNKNRAIESFLLFFPLFSASILIIYAVSAAIILSSLFFRPLSILLIFPIYALFKILGTFRLYMKRGFWTFLKFWTNPNSVCWRTVALLSLLAILEHFLDYYAFLFLPLFSHFLFPAK